MIQPPNQDIFHGFGISRNQRSRGRLDLELRCLVRLAREIQRSARNRSITGWRKRIAAWWRGFDPVSAAVYGLENGVQPSDAALYLRDFSYAYHCYRLNGFWNPILTNKLVMSRVLAATGLPHPEVLGVVTNGNLVAIDADPQPSEDVLTIWI